MRLVVTLVFILATAAADVAGWWWFNRPVPVDISFDEPFPSVSFAPFRRRGLFHRDESPLTKVYPTPAEIASDLASLVGVAKGVRTYTSEEGMQVVPALARKYGLEVTDSAWLGTKPATNDREVAALIKAANAYPDTIKRVIVGNEVLLRKDLTPAQLIGYIRRVRAAIRQPVSYADVWAFWFKHPELADEVDYITIHILPYWEDEPVGVDQAAQHIVDIYRLVHARFPGKPILIGESGWPTRGRERGPAVADMVDAARFVRTLARISKENGFDYNVVEAFDQAWKARMEGTVGANWGVVDGNRHVKYRMSGPVEPNPGWPYQGAAAAALGAAAAWWLSRGGRLPAGRALIAAALGQGLAVLTVWQALNAWWLGYDLTGDLWALLRIALHAGLAAAILRATRSGLADQPWQSRWGERLMPVYGLSAIIATLLLLLHGRYRDIPNLEFLVPCVGVTAYALLRQAMLGLPCGKAFAVGRLFASGEAGGFAPAKQIAIGLWLSVLAAPLSEALALLQGEDFLTMHPTWAERLPRLAYSLGANREMLIWSAMLAVLSLPFWAEWRRLDRRQTWDRPEADQPAASSRATSGAV